jgi:hypothetical protein
MTLSSVVEAQRVFDATNFVGATSPEAKRRHIVFHLGVLLGKVARAEERADHGQEDFTVVVDEVVPDLLVYAAQLCDIFDVDLGRAYQKRLASLEGRNARETRGTKEDYDHPSRS